MNDTMLLLELKMANGSSTGLNWTQADYYGRR